MREVASSPVLSRHGRDALEPQRSRRTLRILVIDDEPAIGRSLTRMLKQRCSVSTATSGREGLNRLGDAPAFDLVLCDLMMPDVTGADVYEQVREQRPEVAQRFVFMTGGAFTVRTREFLAAVPNPRLDKPIEPDTLCRLLDALAEA
jgi:two-component system cell cycle sensor histidine kinase/response regulator CckA